MLVDPMGLEPYYELSLNRKHQSTFDSFRNMWNRLHQKASVGRYVGIKVDPSWVSFKQFLTDLGDRPAGHTLDRMDPEAGYCKDNCRWVRPVEQSVNRRNTYFVDDGEEVLSLKHTCAKHDRDYKSVFYRVTKGGWTLDEALTTPIGGVGSNPYTTERETSGRFKRVKAEDYRIRRRNSEPGRVST